MLDSSQQQPNAMSRAMFQKTFLFSLLVSWLRVIAEGIGGAGGSHHHQNGGELTRTSESCSGFVCVLYNSSGRGACVCKGKEYPAPFGERSGAGNPFWFPHHREEPIPRRVGSAQAPRRHLLGGVWQIHLVPSRPPRSLLLLLPRLRCNEQQTRTHHFTMYNTTSSPVDDE